MLHRLTEWEDNGYDDSDFWVSVYDDETNEVRAVHAGSTRFAGNAPGEGPDLGQPISDPAVLQNAIRLLGEHIFRLLRETEDKDVLEPVAVERGVCVRLLRDCRHKHFVASGRYSGQSVLVGCLRSVSSVTATTDQEGKTPASASVLTIVRRLM